MKIFAVSSLGWCVLVGVCLPGSLPHALGAERPPNCVVILADDLGYGDVGPFGSAVHRTPNLDRMAAEGMKLTSFYAAPCCSPARAEKGCQEPFLRGNIM